MKQNREEQGPSTKKQRLYSCCRSIIILILTVVSLIPIIYLIGSEDSYYAQMPLFSIYDKDEYIQSKVRQVQSGLNNGLFVNINFQQNSISNKIDSTKQWQQIRQFTIYLGYYLNNKNIKTIDRLITAPDIKQKKIKNIVNNDNKKLFEDAYFLGIQGQISILKNKINKIIAGTMKRIKINMRQIDNQDSIRNRVMNQVIGGRVWIITINPANWQNHSSEQLRRQLINLSKLRQNDRFIVISLKSADVNWKKMINISINLQNRLNNIKKLSKNIIRNNIQINGNYNKILQTILCQFDYSLFQINRFLYHCNRTYTCSNTIRYLQKIKINNDQNKLSKYSEELCRQGQISEEGEQQFSILLRQLGFNDDEQYKIQNQKMIKIYYELVNQIECKGGRNCKKDKKVKQKVIKPPKVNRQAIKQQKQGKQKRNNTLIKNKQKSIDKDNKNNKDIKDNKDNKDSKNNKNIKNTKNNKQKSNKVQKDKNKVIKIRQQIKIQKQVKKVNKVNKQQKQQNKTINNNKINNNKSKSQFKIKSNIINIKKQQKIQSICKGKKCKTDNNKIKQTSKSQQQTIEIKQKINQLKQIKTVQNQNQQKLIQQQKVSEIKEQNKTQEQKKEEKQQIQPIQIISQPIQVIQTKQPVQQNNKQEKIQQIQTQIEPQNEIPLEKDVVKQDSSISTVQKVQQIEEQIAIIPIDEGQASNQIVNQVPFHPNQDGQTQ